VGIEILGIMPAELKRLTPNELNLLSEHQKLRVNEERFQAYIAGITAVVRKPNDIFNKTQIPLAKRPARKKTEVEKSIKMMERIGEGGPKAKQAK
jgi:hypothetical protein